MSIPKVNFSENNLKYFHFWCIINSGGDTMPEYETKKIFAENLSRQLQRNKITQIELAKKMNVAASTVSSWCNGEKMPRMDKVEAMAAIFQVAVTDLMEPYNPKPDASRDILDQIDIAFYGEYKELSDDDKETVRDMVRIMRERRAKRQEK